jgi:hypothetical protein
MSKNNRIEIFEKQVTGKRPQSAVFFFTQNRYFDRKVKSQNRAALPSRHSGEFERCEAQTLLLLRALHLHSD